MDNKLLGIKPQKVFLIIALIYGLSFLFINPPLQVIDEASHYDKILYLTDGNVIPEISGHHAGYYIPESAYNLQLNFYSKYRNLDKINLDNILPLLNQHLNDTNKVFTASISGASIITYSPIPYLASALIIVIGKLFDTSPLILMYIGRLANLLIYITLIYMAIRILPVHKWVLLMLALLPMALYQGASLSADSFTIAISFLVIAIFLKFSLDNSINEIKFKGISILFVLILLLALSKQTYYFLIFLFFLIPVRKFGSMKRMVTIFILLFFSTFGISFIWNTALSGFYLPIISQVSIPEQTSYILKNPLNFIHVFINTILNWSILSNIIRSFVGNLGWNFVKIPDWLVVIYLSILTLTCLLDKNDIIINLKEKLTLLITLILIFILICISMYITGTPVAQNTISAIAGRYFIPIAPLIFLLFYNNKIKYEIKNGFNMVIIGIIVISLSTTIYLLINNFYL